MEYTYKLDQKSNLQSSTVFQPESWAVHPWSNFSMENCLFRDEILNPNHIIAATEGDFPPFSVGDSSEDVRGIEISIFTEICRRLGVGYSPRLVEWADILEGLSNGSRDFDCSSASMDITDDRKRRFFMTRPYITTQCKLVYLASQPLCISRQQIESRDTSALNNWKIVTIENSTFENHLRELGANVITTSNVGDVWLQMMHKKQVDAFVTEGRHAAFMIREAQNRMQMQLAVLEHPLHTITKGFAVPHSRPLLFAAIDSTLAALHTEGMLEELICSGSAHANAPRAAQ